MFFVALFAFGRAITNEARQDPYHINGGGPWTIQDCLFYSMTSSAIIFDSDFSSNPLTLKIKEDTFADIKTSEGAGFSIWEKHVNVEISFACFTNCTATSKGAAFFFQCPDQKSFSFSIKDISLSLCSCSERAIYIVGDHQTDLQIDYGNFSHSSSEKETGLYLFCNYNSNINHCTFANNQANTAIISLEESKSGFFLLVNRR